MEKLEKKLREKMYHEIIGQNKNMTSEYLNGLSTQAVINNTNPMNRGLYQEEYNNITKLS